MVEQKEKMEAFELGDVEKDLKDLKKEVEEEKKIKEWEETKEWLNVNNRNKVDKEFDNLWDLTEDEYTKEWKGLKLVFKKSKWKNGERVVELNSMEKDWSEALAPFKLKIAKKVEDKEYEVDYSEFDGSKYNVVSGKTYWDLDGEMTPLLPSDVSSYIDRFYKELFLSK